MSRGAWKYSLAMCCACVAMGWCSALSYAAEIVYGLRTFAGRHAVLTLTGDTGSISLHPSTDGMTIRISGVGVQFLARSENVTGAVVRSVHQVRRGAVNDLVVNFSEPVTISASPNAQGMQILIRTTRGPAQPPVVDGKGINRESSETEARSQPIVILWEHAGRPTRQPGQTVFVFPHAANIGAQSSLTAGLHWFVYAVDLLWAWLNGGSLALSSTAGEPSTADSENVQNESSALLQQLTEEVLMLREKVKELEGRAKQ